MFLVLSFFATHYNFRMHWKRACKGFSDKRKRQQTVQGLQAFAFSVLIVNDKHTGPRFKRKSRG